jgi:glycosyltransferase involved in cell wall biosynthesis
MRVAWCTNLYTPYRDPLWRSMTESLDVDVWLLARSEVNRHWGAPGRALDGPSYKFLDAVSVALMGTVLYVSAPTPCPLSEFDCLIVGGWDSPFYWWLVARARVQRIPVVVFYESTAQSQRFQRGPVALVRRAMFRSAQAVLTVGSGARAAVLAAGADPERVFTGFNAVDGVALKDASLPIRRESPFGHRFLVVGQLIARKNVGAVIRAFDQVAAPADELTIAGDGPDRAALEAMVPVGRRDVVHFVGHVSTKDLPRIYANADTLVLASTQEVWGLVVNEALACGLHAVVSAAAGVAIEIHGMPGAFVVDANTSAIAKAMHESRAAWDGPIPDPPVLKWTPEALAQAALDAVAAATARIR